MTFVLSSNQIGQQITKLAHRKNVGWLAGPGGLQSVYDGLKSDYDDYSNYDDMHPAIVRDAKYSVADKNNFSDIQPETDSGSFRGMTKNGTSKLYN